MFPALATANGAGAPRKRIATYGKTARKRIPHYQAPAKIAKAQSPANIQADEAGSSSPATPTSVSSPVKRSIFDVPSSDDEDATMPISKKKRSPVASVPKKKVPEVQKVKADEGMAIMQSRKRVKLSPAPKQSLRQLPVTKAQTTMAVAKVPTKVAPKAVPKEAQKAVQKEISYKPPALVPASGHTTSIASRPRRNDTRIEKDILKSAESPNWKIAGKKVGKSTPRRVEKVEKTTIQTPKKAAQAPPPQKTPQRRKPSLDTSDVDMMDLDVDGDVDVTPKAGRKHLSPKASQLWEGLLDSTKTKDQMPIKPNAGLSFRGKVELGSSSMVSTNAKQIQVKPRRRLIDILVSQLPQEDEEDEDESMDESSAASSSESQSPTPEPASRPSLVTDSQVSQASQIAGPKITYSRSRSMLEEEDLMLELSQPLPSMPDGGPQGRRRTRRASMPKLPKLASFREDEDEGGTAIRSVHELRAAGASTRVSDELEDLIDRIGKPTTAQASGRRAGLLELAKELKDKNFSRHFFMESAHERLFLGLGQETDIISGFVLVSILITVLGEVDVLPFVLQLRRQGITRLLIRLLDVQSSIAIVAKDRKSNTSKVAQKLISDHHEYVMELKVWEPLQPKSLSPRTLALKCLEVMTEQTRQARSEDEIFSKELTARLFTILKIAFNGKSWDFPTHESMDFYLALSALTAHSTKARTVQDEKIWITDFLPIIADTLEHALSQPFQTHGPLQHLIFSLTVNVTNNNAKASDVFARGALSRKLGEYVVAKFQQISGFMLQAESEIAVNHLILLLASMIQFADQSLKSRASMERILLEEGDNTLETMVTIWFNNQEKIAEVSTDLDFLVTIY